MTALVIANGKQTQIQLPCTLEVFLTRQKLLPRSVIVELNNRPIQPSEFKSLQLSSNDRLEIVRIIAGG